MKIDLERQAPGRTSVAVAEEFELEDIAGGPERVRLAGEVQVDHMESRVLVTGKLVAATELPCDRCQEAFFLEYEVPLEILILRDFPAAEELDSWVLHQGRGEVVLDGPLLEATVLALPQKRVCRPECRGYCSGCGADLNQADCRCTTTETDPRWDGLPSG